LFDVCTGFRRPLSGSVMFNGVDVTRAGPIDHARLGMGRTFQRPSLFDSMTVLEIVALAAESLSIDAKNPLSYVGFWRGGTRRRRDAIGISTAVLDRLGLTGHADSLVGGLPAGTARMVELARALARSPSMLLLDEPFAGLDDSEQETFQSVVSSLVREDGLGVLLVEHNMDLVLRMCDWIYVLDFGHNLTSGRPNSIRASAEVRAAYLGEPVD
jgi:branched-chain amino acid transport system ATP-binding protein